LVCLPCYVNDVLKFASDEWVQICEWHSAVKHFHSSRPNQKLAFKDTLFKSKFDAAMKKGRQWVPTLRASGWTSKDIPEKMKMFFCHDEEGRVLYDVLRLEHANGLERHRDERRSLGDKLVTLPQTKSMIANILIGDVGLAVSQRLRWSSRIIWVGFISCHAALT
jgi:hypothetical protein